MKDFRSLQVWRKAHNLALNIYPETTHFPKQELYGLTSQLRRASLSIPTNIVEGCGRGSDADMKRFLHIAMGSACELECRILFARDVGYILNETCQQLTDDIQGVKRMPTPRIKAMRAMEGMPSFPLIASSH